VSCARARLSRGLSRGIQGFYHLVNSRSKPPPVAGLDDPHYTHVPKSAHHRTAGREKPGDAATTQFTPTPAERQDDALRAAFCDLHSARLHGFALIVALGDVRAARAATEDSLAAGARRAATLRHPERAAAWLRARVLRRLRRRRVSIRPSSTGERQAALAPLGVDAATFTALAVLSPEGRAGLAATMIERFEPIDVETILGMSARAARRVLDRANRQFLEAIPVTSAPDAAVGTGDLSRRVHAVADRAMAMTSERRIP